MITAVLYRTEDRYTGFRAEGHSGYAEAGSDIVCAAVSVLGCTCVNALESLLGVRVLLNGNEDGLLDFDLPEIPKDQEKGAQLLMGALRQGLSDLEEGYPAYIRLQIKGRRKKP